jgi:hypothetical protein
MVGSDENMDRILTLLHKYWGLTCPNLILTVTGGAKSFQMSKHITRKFRQGIVRASQSAGAWIITGGTNEGVMRHTGKAIRDFAVRSTGKGSQEAAGDIVCLGIATWGIIKNRSLLTTESRGGKYGKNAAQYDIKKKNEDDRDAYLDPNHTHFLLVDDGTESKYGGEIAFRAQLESRLASGGKTNSNTG